MVLSFYICGIAMLKFDVDNNEKDKIVSTYFAAAEAMNLLESLAPMGGSKTVSPASLGCLAGREANAAHPQISENACLSDDPRLGSDGATSSNELSQMLDSVRSTKTGVEAFMPTPEIVKPGYISIAAGGNGASQASTLMSWEDMEKHQWMLDVLSDLEVYACENSLAQTAEALVTARCELISRAARAR